MQQPVTTLVDDVLVCREQRARADVKYGPHE